MFTSKEQKTKNQADEYRKALDIYRAVPQKNPAEELEYQYLITMLSQQYLQPNNGGLFYRRSDLIDYLDDYFYLNIFAAAEFIKIAIHEDPEQVEKMLDAKLDVDESHKQELRNEINKVQQSKKYKMPYQIEEQALRYLGASDHPIIMYNINDLNIYILDWLQGVGPAEEYIVKALEENPFAVTAELNHLWHVPDILKLTNLVLIHENKIEDAFLKGVLYFKQSLFVANLQGDDAAKVLEEAYKWGVLESLLGEVSYENNIYIKRILQLNALVYIQNEDIIEILCKYLEKYSYTLYYYGLSPEYNDSFQTFVHLLERIKRKLQQNPPTSVDDFFSSQKNPLIKVEKKFALEFYIASLKMDLPVFQSLAKSNPAVFYALFTHEVSHSYPRIANYHKDREKLLEIRKDFYLAFMTHQALQDFPFKETCRISLKVRFPDLKQSLESRQPANLSTEIATKFHDANEVPTKPLLAEANTHIILTKQSSATYSSSSFSFLSNLLSSSSKNRWGSAKKIAKKDQEDMREMEDMSNIVSKQDGPDLDNVTVNHPKR